MGKKVNTKIAVRNGVCQFEPIVFITWLKEDSHFSCHSFYACRYNGIKGVMVRLASDASERLYLFLLTRGEEYFRGVSKDIKTMPLEPMPAELAIFGNRDSFIKIDEDWFVSMSGNGKMDVIELLEKVGVDTEYWFLSDFKGNISKGINKETLQPFTDIPLSHGKYDIMIDGNKKAGTVDFTEHATTVKVRKGRNLRLSRPKDTVSILHHLRIGISDLVPSK